MRRIFLFVVALLVGVVMKAQDCPITQIEQEWKAKPISNVVNGSLGVMIERFDQTWPTSVVGLVRKTMEKGLSKEVIDEETGLTVTVDAKNGYVEVNDGGTDGEYMSACVWNRQNGHKLFAVCLGKPTDPCLEFVCFYDYDAQKKMLTPEPDILKGYRWGDRETYTQFFYKLPKVGKDLIVNEWGDGAPQCHTFAWNGMKPVFSKTEPLEMDEPSFEKTVNFKGAEPNIKDFVTALLTGEDIGEALNYMKDAWELYLNGMKQMPGDEFTVDKENGYMGFESLDGESERMLIECCYWNYADKKHKLVALTNDLFIDGKATMGQYSGIEFFIYDNATHKMNPVSSEELNLDFDYPSDTKAITHALPRQGKTIVYTIHTAGGKIEKRMTWNGSKFIPASK